LIALVFIGLLGLYLINRFLKAKEFQNPLLKKIQGFWDGFIEGLSSLAEVKNKPLLIFYSFGIWFCYFLMTYLCFFAFEPVAHLSALTGLIVFVFGTIGMVFPSPGGMGSYQFAIVQALLLFGITGADAFSFSNIIFFAVNIFGNIVFGIIFFLILPFFKKSN